jgi:hypothetical protein
MIVNAKGCRDFDEMLKYMFEIGRLSGRVADANVSVYMWKRL